MTATRDRERRLVIVSLSDQTLIAHCGQAPPVIGRTAVAVVGWRIVRISVLSGIKVARKDLFLVGVGCRT